MDSQIFEAIPGIWCVRLNGTCAYLVKLLPGGGLVDTGPDPTGASVMYMLQKARVGLRSLRAILLTHADYDASAGAARLGERSEAPLYASSPQTKLLRQERWPEPEPKRGVLARKGPNPATAPPVSLEVHEPPLDGTRIHDIDNFDVARLDGAPGTDPEGHLAFYYRPAAALFSGDAVEIADTRWHALGSRAEKLRERFPDVRALFPNHGAPQTDANDVRERWTEME